MRPLLASGRVQGYHHCEQRDLNAAMLIMTSRQMSAGQRPLYEGFVERLSDALATRYTIPFDDQLRSFVDDRRRYGLDLGFETDQQIADFAEACFLTRNEICADLAFVALMQRPLMRAETKAAEMLRRWVWPHPSWVPGPKPKTAQEPV